MEKDEFAEDLGIEGQGEYSESGSYIISLDEDGWQRAQVSLYQSDEVEEDQDGSSVSYEMSNLQYVNDFFIINLIADFNADEYRFVIKDR